MPRNLATLVRPSRGGLVPIAAKLHRDQLEELDRIAAETGRNRSEVLRDVIDGRLSKAA